MEQEIYNLISSATKFIIGLSKLEIFLIAINLFMLFAFTYVLKQWLILRYIFFISSDWCADKIKEICEDSTQIIIENVNQIYEMKYGKTIESGEAMKYVATSISNGHKDWFIQKEEFQARLEKNGQPRLGVDDGWFSLGSRWMM